MRQGVKAGWVIMDEVFDYRGDCWKAYQDVGLCLRLLPRKKSFQFIIEKNKLEKIKKVISHNGGEILEETHMDNDVQLKVATPGLPKKEDESSWPILP